MKFKVGDKVKINKKIISFKYGKGGVSPDVIGKIIGVKEDNEYYVDFPLAHCWHGLEKELVLVSNEYTYEDLKKSPVGTKVTFEKGRTLIKIDENYYRETNENGIIRYFSNLKGLKDNYHNYLNQGRIIKIEEPTYKIVYEVKPEILDEAEKKYLSNVIRPFRDKIKYIIKVKSSYDNNFYIRIVLNNDVSTLPKYKKNTMYKGMKIDKEYALEELGL